MAWVASAMASQRMSKSSFNVRDSISVVFIINTPSYGIPEYSMWMKSSQVQVLECSMVCIKEKENEKSQKDACTNVQAPFWRKSRGCNL